VSATFRVVIGPLTCHFTTFPPCQEDSWCKRHSTSLPWQRGEATVAQGPWPIAGNHEAAGDQDLRFSGKPIYDSEKRHRVNLMNDGMDEGLQSWLEVH
ncbi:hypothetical protein AVEN_37953-1, partial [Araneus ventricosus]